MTQNNIKIAITGGIGSGKSTVSQIIRERGLPVFSCDEIYNELLNSGGLTEKIAKTFNGVLTDSGELDRKKLAAKVFNNSALLKRLNEITHSEIMSAAFEKMKGQSISFLEVPLLFEDGLETRFDEVIVVLRDIDERISSVSKRNGIDAVSVQNRIKSQINYDNCDFTKYYVIHNNSNLSCLRHSTLDLIEKIIEKYSKNF